MGWCLHPIWGVLKKNFSLRELTPLPLSYTPTFQILEISLLWWIKLCVCVCVCRYRQRRYSPTSSMFCFNLNQSRFRHANHMRRGAPIDCTTNSIKSCIPIIIILFYRTTCIKSTSSQHQASGTVYSTSRHCVHWNGRYADTVASSPTRFCNLCDLYGHRNGHIKTAQQRTIYMSKKALPCAERRVLSPHWSRSDAQCDLWPWQWKQKRKKDSRKLAIRLDHPRRRTEVCMPGGLSV